MSGRFGHRRLRPSPGGRRRRLGRADREPVLVLLDRPPGKVVEGEGGPVLAVCVPDRAAVVAEVVRARPEELDTDPYRDGDLLIGSQDQPGRSTDPQRVPVAV